MTNREFVEDTLVIATHNDGKMEEFKKLFSNYPFRILSAKNIGLAEPEETEDSFVGNAILKARAAAFKSNKPALSDDSGLCVKILNGAPGIHSARWAGPSRDFKIAMERVKNALLASKSYDKRAKFVCALALVWPDGVSLTVEGAVKGELTFPPKGEKGFGYDPIFQPAGHTISFGEMEPSFKHSISHRSIAFKKLIKRCFNEINVN